MAVKQYLRQYLPNVSEKHPLAGYVSSHEEKNRSWTTMSLWQHDVRSLTQRNTGQYALDGETIVRSNYL